jgi:GNAT superfamily N-acetyltransferase
MPGSSDFLIRAARHADAPAVARLVTQLGYPVSSEEMGDRLKTLRSRRDYRLFVAEIAGTVVGLVGGYLAYALEFTPPYGRLIGLVVEEQWRGRGIGRRLMSRIEGWMQAQGAVQLLITSGKQRTRAHEFYKQLGYVETGLRFYKQL